jgi:hypothetical protein
MHFSNLQALQMSFSCSKEVDSSTLWHICAKSTSIKTTLLCLFYLTAVFLLFLKRIGLPSRFGNDSISKISHLGLDCNCGSRCVWYFTTFVSVKTYSGSIVFIWNLWNSFEIFLTMWRPSLNDSLKLFQIMFCLFKCSNTY